MNIEVFIRDIKERGFDTYFISQRGKPYYKFEQLVLKLLSLHLKDQGKTFTTYFDSETEGLAYDGIDDLIGPTSVEIKLSLPSNNSIENILDKMFSISEVNFHSVLFIFGSKISNKDRQLIEKKTYERNRNIPIKIWDSNNIITLLQRYAEFISDIIPELTELAVDNVVKKSLNTDPLDWKRDRDRQIENLKESYKTNDLTLFLGAGISIKAGAPNWKSLISSLLVELIGEKLPDKLNTSDEEKNVIADYIQEIHGTSPLLEARYIRNGLGESFGEAVSKYLYKNIDKNGGTSKTLQAIAKLCIPPRDGLGVRAVVTYNFDDLVEKNLDNLGIKKRCIYRDKDVANQNEIGIYHVHGFLPRDIGQYDGLTESLLIFSEEGYHTVFIEPYSWSNLVQLNFLRESTCLLVGLSVTDPNLRRLLDIAAKKSKGPKHYVFLKRFDSLSSKSKSNTLREEVSQTFLSVHHQLQEKSFNELGLNIIWIEDYEKDIPQILESLRK